MYSNIDRELILSKREDLEGTKGLDENALYHLRDALTKIREYHETEDEQRSSIDGSFRKKMSLFYLPTVRKCTDGNDFDLRQLRREDITVYVGVNAEDMSSPMTSSTCSLTSLWKSRYEKTLTLTRH